MTIGIMQILQSDNGREFKGALLLLMKQHNVRIKNGRPRTPQTQGLVKQANSTVKHQICTYQIENGTRQWAKALSGITYSMNTTWCEALPYGVTPYEVLYGRKPYRNPDPEEVKEMLGGIGEKEIIQGPGQDSEGNSHSVDEEIEELLGLVPEEEDQQELGDAQEPEDEQSSEVEQGLEGEGISSHTVISGSEALSADDVESEDSDRSLDKEVQEKNKRNREKMIQKYSKQHTVVIFKAGDLAMLRIPKDDLAPTDNRRIACLILDVPYYNRYKLRMKYGIITHLYPTGQLNTVPEELQAEMKEEILKGSKEELPLHTIALLASTADRVGISCNCKKRCTRTCRCQKNNVACSIYCHAEEDLDCGNLSGLKERTERALVNKESEKGKKTSLASRKRARASTVVEQ